MSIFRHFSKLRIAAQFSSIDRHFLFPQPQVYDNTGILASLFACSIKRIFSSQRDRASLSEPPPPPSSPPPSPLPSPSARVFYLLRSFRRSGSIKQKALLAHIPHNLFSSAAATFTKAYLLHPPHLANVLAPLEEIPDDASAHDHLFIHFLAYVQEQYSQEIETHKALASALDLCQPHTFYPVARSLKRKIIYHAGPTNSGKTFNALQALQGAESGVYAAPLRLLAVEVYDALNAGGTFCHLITGQERREVPGALHTACTVEMVSLTHRVDVAVLDEVQMIGDKHRGFAWSRALLGLPANEVHVCGDISALELVEWMAEQTGEEVEVCRYDRFTPLKTEGAGLDSYTEVRPGDCVVAFSRRDIYAIKAEIEGTTPHRCCVVYGALPPEVRRRQARLFNDPNNGYTVMVASDAVGMGLNLNIGRIIFNSLHKFEEGRRVMVPPSAVKQIAGRAGRRSSQFSEGKATTLNRPGAAYDMKALLEGHLAVSIGKDATPRAGLAPEFEQFEAYASLQPPHTPLSTMLQEFEREAVLHGRYFFCKQEAVLTTATILERIPGLSLRDAYYFAMAPASSSDVRLMAALVRWARQIAAGDVCTLDVQLPEDTRPPSSADEMKAFESAHAIITLWLWLSHRFGTGSGGSGGGSGENDDDDDAQFMFPQREAAIEIAQRICDLLNKGLELGIKSGGDSKDAGRAAQLTAMLSMFDDDAVFVRQILDNQKSSTVDEHDTTPKKEKKALNKKKAYSQKKVLHLAHKAPRRPHRRNRGRMRQLKTK